MSMYQADVREILLIITKHYYFIHLGARNPEQGPTVWYVHTEAFFFPLHIKAIFYFCVRWKDALAGGKPGVPWFHR